jgi:hypothetical protein
MLLKPYISYGLFKLAMDEWHLLLSTIQYHIAENQPQKFSGIIITWPAFFRDPSPKVDSINKEREEAEIFRMISSFEKNFT